MARPIDPNSTSYKLRELITKNNSITPAEAAAKLGLSFGGSFSVLFNRAKAQVAIKAKGYIVRNKLKRKRIGKWVAGTDSHGYLIDKKAGRSFLSYVDHQQPDHILHLGDAWDYAALRGGASPEERSESCLIDYAEGESFLTSLYQGRKAERIFLWGNHDDRINVGMTKLDGQQKDLCTLLNEKTQKLFKRLNVHQVPFHKRDGIYKLGKMNFLHGYCHGENTAKKHVEIYGSEGAVIAGDMHSIQYWRSVSLARREGYHIGCLCNLEPSYMSRKPGGLRWEHGWAFGTVDYDTGEYTVAQAISTPSGFLVPNVSMIF